MPFTEPWDEANPTDLTPINQGDDHIRRALRSTRERLAVEHYAYQDETGQTNVGKHKPGSAKILSSAAASLPANDSAAPGTLAHVTDAGAERIVKDTGTAWETVKHASQHAPGGPDPVDADKLDGQHLADLDARYDARYVNASGDTMTGDLITPAYTLDTATARTYSNYLLGTNADPNPGDIILLVPDPDTPDPVPSALFSAIVLADRGGTYSLNSRQAWYVVVGRGHTGRSASIWPLAQSSASIKIVQCIYNGQRYLAIDTTAIGFSRHKWSFAGVWGNNINSQPPAVVPRASVTGITDFAAMTKVWHDGNDGAGSQLDSDLLDGMQPSTSATANTIVQRDASGDLTGRVLRSTVATGTAPLAVNSSTAVTNLNADLLDDWHRDAIRDWNNILNKPSSFPPSAHAASHHSGGSDALSLGSIAGTLTDAQHGSRGGGTLHAAATSTTAGFMSAADKARLDGATASATASTLVLRDAAGRAKFAAPAAAGDAVVYPVPVTALKLAQGSASAGIFAVHQYAFASPSHSYRTDRSVALVIGARNDDGADPGDRCWAGLKTGGFWQTDADVFTSGNFVSMSTWDYLTASGHPSLWAAIDDAGRIVSMWEAEDPADPDFPDEPPIGAPEGAVAVVPLQIPDVTILQRAAERVQTVAGSQWLTKSKHRGKPSRAAHHDMFCEQCHTRGLETPPDIRDVYASIDDHDRRHWYVQLYLRQASRLIHDHRASTLIPLYQDMLRVDRRNGRLELS